jgi:hypothetical protein
MQKGKPMYRLTPFMLRQYCIINKLFTCGSNYNYDRLFDLLRNGEDLRVIAAVIWACSDTEKTVSEIAAELLELERSARSA